jgi:tetratricopeptide (TPR) repeat protein
MIRPLPLLLALCLSLPASAASLDEARQRVDERRYAEAITLYDTLLGERPGDADLLIEAGRVNAWADRHADAARRYRQAIAAAPQRRDDVLLALAWQLAWGGQHEEAIPLFREVAERLPAQKNEALHGLAESLAASKHLVPALDVYRALAADPADLRARKGEARVLLWLDRHDEAILCYRAILDTAPTDKEAQIGLARALNYRGRHFEAAVVYARAVENDPTLARDTRTERATALRWAGLEDAAFSTLGDAPGRDAAGLRSRLGQEIASHLRAELESAWDSDDLDINALNVGWQQRFSGGRWFDVSARAASIEQGADRIDGRQLLLKGGGRFGSVEEGLFWPALTVGVRDYEGWQTAVWKLQGRWLPADFWRVDLEAGNDVVETVEALRNEVTLNLVSASADWMFAPRWRATLGGALLRFDDGNLRKRMIGRVEHVARVAQPRLVLGVEGMGFNDSDPAIDRGYYNPETYRELKALARVEHETHGWLLEGRLALGMLWESPGDDSGLYAWEVAAARDLAPMLRLRLYAGGSDSSAYLQGTGSGYTRNYAGASLLWFF